MGIALLPKEVNTFYHYFIDCNMNVPEDISISNAFSQLVREVGHDKMNEFKRTVERSKFYKKGGENK